MEANAGSPNNTNSAKYRLYQFLKALNLENMQICVVLSILLLVISANK